MSGLCGGSGEEVGIWNDPVNLLFDQNICYKLVNRLGDLYPRSRHVREVGLGEADDLAVWNFARDNGFVIVSKDEDFHQRSFLSGAPPKVVWLRLGNCTMQEIEDALRHHRAALVDFAAQDEAAFLVIGARRP
jgi:predicted nuclease of predicted toxin-antitoxin system